MRRHEHVVAICRSITLTVEACTNGVQNQCVCSKRLKHIFDHHERAHNRPLIVAVVTVLW